MRRANRKLLGARSALGGNVAKRSTVRTSISSNPVCGQFAKSALVNRPRRWARISSCFPIGMRVSFLLLSNRSPMAEKKDVQQGTLALMVLKTLQTLGPLHGYGIARRIEQTSGD